MVSVLRHSTIFHVSTIHATRFTKTYCYEMTAFLRRRMCIEYLKIKSQETKLCGPLRLSHYYASVLVPKSQYQI